MSKKYENKNITENVLIQDRLKYDSYTCINRYCVFLKDDRLKNDGAFSGMQGSAASELEALEIE